MSSGRKHEIARLADEDNYRCSIEHNLLALEVAAIFEPDLKKAMDIAPGILDWALRESDECPRRKLEQESQRCFRERGGR